MTYIIHYDFGHWQEKTSFTTKTAVLNWLRNGMQPKDCRIFVEHNGERTEWDCNADYAKPWRKAPLRQATKKLLAEQKDDNIAACEWLDKCRRLRGRKSV